MQPFIVLHRTLVLFGIISLMLIAYATIMMNNFKTPETTADFFKNSNTYYYISEIVKTDIRSRYPLPLRTNLIALTIADTILNTVVSPSLVEHVTLPVLRVRKNIAQLPLSFAENNLVFNTSQYTQQASTMLASLNLPSVVIAAGNNLIASVPKQITIVDVQKNPESILARITRVRIFFDNLETFLRVAWIIFVVSLLGLIVLNIPFLLRFIRGIMILFTITGVLVLIFSFVLPAILALFVSNPDPIAGELKNDLINSMTVYYFSQTFPLAIVYLVLAFLCYLIIRIVPFSFLQNWTDIHILRKSLPAKTKATPRSPRKKVKRS